MRGLRECVAQGISALSNFRRYFRLFPVVRCWSLQGRMQGDSFSARQALQTLLPE